MTLSMFRQGDVLLIQTSRQLPLFGPDTGSQDVVVLAHGEKTGHTHAVPAADAMLQTVTLAGVEVRQLLVSRPTRVSHEEHAPVPLEPGEYRVVIQRQFNPTTDMPVGD